MNNILVEDYIKLLYNWNKIYKSKNKLFYLYYNNLWYLVQSLENIIIIYILLGYQIKLTCI